METHGNHDAFVDCDDDIVSSRAMEDLPVVVDKSSTRIGTNEDGQCNEARLRQVNAVHEFDHADADMLIGDRVDVFMNALVARAHETPERTCVIPVSVDTVANIASGRHPY